MDMIAVAPPVTETLRPYFASTWEMQWKQCAINSAMLCDPEDAFFHLLAAEADRIAENGNHKFADTGPFLLQRLIPEHKLEKHVAPWWEFCPYPWRQIMMSNFGSNREWFLNRLRLVKQLVSQQTRSDFKAAYVRRGSRAVHLHNEIWRQAGLSKEGPFHPRSFVGKALKQHGIK